jgi:uncharacterized protein (TIGR00251 family)
LRRTAASHGRRFPLGVSWENRGGVPQAEEKEVDQLRSMMFRPGIEESGWLKSSSGRLLVEVKVLPGSSSSRAGGMRDGALLVRVAAPPEKGKANEELRACLARALGIPKSEVELVSGAASRRKRLSLPAEVEPALRSLAAGQAPAP